MQALPIQLLSKSAKAQGPADASAKAGGEVATEQSDVDFSSLFANLTAPVGEVKGEVKGEAKTDEKILALKGEEKNVGEIEIDSKQAEALLAALAANPEVAAQLEVSIDQKIAKTSNGLDQLLNSLKGTGDSAEIEEGVESNNDPLQNIRSNKNEKSIKGELKTESPLDFIINGSKTKGASVDEKSSEPSDIESLLGQKKIVTGEDYLNNMGSADKKNAGKLALINGMELPKNSVQNVKAYGQGLALLSDPLIKNTKDLAFKDGAKSKHASADELLVPDLKVGAELGAIKQDVIPMMHNQENKNSQTDARAEGSQKVLDLGSLNTSNTNEIIKRISDYVEQNHVANQSSLDLNVKHESLGEFKIQVSKMPNSSSNSAQNLIDMQITTSSKEGHDFFVKNEIGLMKNLNTAGINLSDLRIVSGSSESQAFGQTDSRQSHSQHNSDPNSKEFRGSSFSSEFSNGKERRKELWEEYQQRYGA